jgi:outer membrane protein
MTQAGVPAVLPDGKIAVINTSAFPGGISELKVKYEQVENQFKDRFNRLQSLDQQLKQLENEMQAKRGVLTADKLQEMQIKYEDDKKRGQRDLEDLRSDYSKAEDVATRPVREKIYQFLQNYATQRGIVLIINLPGAAQTGSLAYWSPGADITQDFITEYNKANPVAGAPAAQPKANPQPPAANKPAAKP